MVTSFTRQLGWSSLEILVSQFQDRLQFGVSRDLLDLMRLPILTGYRARALYNSGIQNLVDLASADVCSLENVLFKAVPFESEKKIAGETDYEAKERNKFKTVWVCGRNGMTEREAALLLISDARKYLEREMGVKNVQWSNLDENQIDNSDSESLFELQLSPDKESEPADGVDSDKSLFDDSRSSDSLDDAKHCTDQKLNENIVISGRKRKFSDDFIASSPEVTTTPYNSTGSNADRTLNEIYMHTPSKKSHIQTYTDFQDELEIRELDIIDVCKNRQLFETFFAEIQSQSVLSVSVACSATEYVAKAAIGSNIIRTENPKVLPETAELKYKNIKINGLAVSWESNAVYYINLSDNDITIAEKLKLIQSAIFANTKTVRMFDAKQQIKLLKLSTNLKVDCFIEDPKVADWILQPEDKEKSLLAMVLKTNFAITVTLTILLIFRQ